MVAGGDFSYLVGSARRLVLLLSLVCVVATGASPQKKKPWYCSRAMLVAAGMTAILAAGPAIVHTASSYLSGGEHIGHGIYMDMDQVRSQLSSYEQSQIDDPRVSIQEKVQIFTDRLEGNYGNWLFSPVALPSNASDYLDPKQIDRGVCRHKACVLNSILQHLEIKSTLQSGNSKGAPYRWHVWVYLPDLGKVADPTTGRIANAAEYYKDYDFYMNGVPLPRGWY